MANLEALRDLKIQTRCARPTLGISFVAMRRNLAELPEVLRSATAWGAKFLVSNVYPHTPELLQEILYSTIHRRVALESSDDPDGADGSESDRSGYPAKRDAWFVYPTTGGP